MLADYDDIKKLINQEPLWYDANGVPRYAAFDPEMCPNIYSDYVVLFEIECQRCGKRFKVEEHEPTFLMPYDKGKFHTIVENKELGYGDPPRHDCSGDTMTSEPLYILEVWRRWLGEGNDRNPDWVRCHELEGRIEE